MPLNKVTADSIADGTVIAADIADGSITSPKIAAGAVTGNTLSTNIINANNIVNSSILGNDLADNVIRANNIVAATITGNLIATNQITGNLIATGQITGNLLATNIINANNIVDASITAAKLAPGAAVSNGQLSVVSSAVGVIADSAAGRLPYKILGQIQTTANVLTTIYTVPAATNTMITTITICNQSSNDSVLINVAANISGSAVTTRNFIVSGYSLGGAETLVLEPRISLNVGSILSANITGANASSNISINAFGVEII
jgi:hypothetical protein